MTVNEMKELIEAIVKPLVDSPEYVEIIELENDDQITYRLSVHKEDIGKVIGKQGRIAKAIRTVVNAAGSTSSKRILLEIKD